MLQQRTRKMLSDDPIQWHCEYWTLNACFSWVNPFVPDPDTSKVASHLTIEFLVWHGGALERSKIA